MEPEETAEVSAASYFPQEAIASSPAVPDAGVKDGKADETTDAPGGQDPEIGISPAWSQLAKEVWTYEESRVKRWRNEIHTLLVFAGLFSAVVTAFVVQYYAVLQPEAPNFNTIILEQHTVILERTACILERISSQLGDIPVESIHTALTATAATATHPKSEPFTRPPPPSPPQWIATLWFASLVCSVAAASMALAVNQWLNFHAEQAGLRSAPQKLWTWRLRRDALNKWKVEFIVGLLPCLLQIALVLFLLGIAGYLKAISAGVALPSMVLMCFLFLFLIITTCIPAFVEYSPYKSPQAWWICRIVRWIHWAICWVMWRICLWLRPVVLFAMCKRLGELESSIHSGDSLFSHAGIPSRWIMDSLCSFADTIMAAYRALDTHQAYLHKVMETSNWVGHEQLRLHGITSRRAESTLFSDIYSIALDVDVLRSMETCLKEISPSLAFENVLAIGKARGMVLSSREDAYSPQPLQYDKLDNIVTVMTGRMVLNTCLEGDMTVSNALLESFKSDSNRDALAGLIRAMPYNDATQLCIALFEHLQMPSTSRPIGDDRTRAILDVIQNIYVPVNSHLNVKDRGYRLIPGVAMRHCEPHATLRRLRNTQGKY
ncbi:uncharacterized protein B0H18DRAFT_1123254 [Fomitopsis serialis]|uniref:uncharacterized protein n=1 Tax=Fomitopsis serialis TaxID=139415 RepID=UPI00200827C7|nr:uncharacterized protein B0H18DRAFT_1123254 [Neoantrodia serialis]KAH9918095.1 hypothetical protein B0H18DRAFT_1123254 [Neoantrodia serialis]